MANQAQARGKRTVADRIRKLLVSNDEASVEYLKESFLSSAMLTLARIRRESGLTQAEVAKRLKTTQSAIARTEADLAGSISLRRYVEIAAACGVVPLDISLEPMDAVRRFAAVNPQTPRTVDRFTSWVAAQSLAQELKVSHQQLDKAVVNPTMSTMHAARNDAPAAHVSSTLPERFGGQGSAGATVTSDYTSTAMGSVSKAQSEPQARVPVMVA